MHSNVTMLGNWNTAVMCSMFRGPLTLRDWIMFVTSYSHFQYIPSFFNTTSNSYTQFLYADIYGWTGKMGRLCIIETTWRSIQASYDNTTRKKMEKGRPRLKWISEISLHAKLFSIRNWKIVALGRERWKKLLEEAKTQPCVVAPVMRMIKNNAMV